MDTTKQKSTYFSLVFLGVIIIAINLRPGMTAVGPLLGIIRDDLGLANWSVGLLTSLPLLAFAMISPIVPRLGVKWTNERTMVIGLLLLAIGIFIQSTSLISFISLSTIIVGFGFAICSVFSSGGTNENVP